MGLNIDTAENIQRTDLISKVTEGENVETPILVAVVGNIDSETYNHIVATMQEKVGYAFARFDKLEQVDSNSFGVPEIVLLAEDYEEPFIPKCNPHIFTVTTEPVTEKGDNRLSLSSEVKGKKKVWDGKKQVEVDVHYIDDAVESIVEKAMSKRFKELYNKYEPEIRRVLNGESGIDFEGLLELYRQKDATTYGHIVGVTNLGNILLEGMELSGYTENMTLEDKNNFITMAYLHDVGKLFTPNQLIKNEDAFSPNEFNAMKNHVKVNTDLAGNEATRELLEVAVKHHYRFDGTGYLEQTEVGKNIPLPARMLTVVDSFDAICDSNRTYQSSEGIESKIMYGIEILSKPNGNNGQFDPDIARAFLVGFGNRLQNNNLDQFVVSMISKDLGKDVTPTPELIEERRQQIVEKINSVLYVNTDNKQVNI